jgi:hypothetical protein
MITKLRSVRKLFFVFHLICAVSANLYSQQSLQLTDVLKKSQIDFVDGIQTRCPVNFPETSYPLTILYETNNDTIDGVYLIVDQFNQPRYLCFFNENKRIGYEYFFDIFGNLKMCNYYNSKGTLVSHIDFISSGVSEIYNSQINGNHTLWFGGRKNILQALEWTSYNSGYTLRFKANKRAKLDEIILLNRNGELIKKQLRSIK